MAFTVTGAGAVQPVSWFAAGPAARDHRSGGVGQRQVLELPCRELLGRVGHGVRLVLPRGDLLDGGPGVGGFDILDGDPTRGRHAGGGSCLGVGVDVRRLAALRPLTGSAADGLTWCTETHPTLSPLGGG